MKERKKERKKQANKQTSKQTNKLYDVRKKAETKDFRKNI